MRNKKEIDIPAVGVLDRVFQVIDQELAASESISGSELASEVYKEYENDPIGFITKVLREEITDDIQEICRSVTINIRTLAKSANGTGKTHGAARIIVWWYKCKSRSQVWTAAAPPEENLKLLLWGEISGIVSRNPHVFSNDTVSIASLSITSKKDPQNFVKGVAIPQAGDPKKVEARFSGKHAPNLLFVIDEADAVPQEVFNGIESCMSGGEARLLCLFNPRQSSGPVYQFEVKREAHVVSLCGFNHPNVITGRDIFPGAVRRSTTIERIHKWTRALYDGEKIEDDVFRVPMYMDGLTHRLDNGEWMPPLIGGQYRKIIDDQFAYMVLGIYPSIGSKQLFSAAAIKIAVERRKIYLQISGGARPAGVNPRLGCDIADMGSDKNCVSPKYEGFVDDFILWGGLEIPTSVRKIREIYVVRNACGAWVDSNGLGAAVPPLLEELGCIAYRINSSENAKETNEPSAKTDRVRDQMAWNARMWLHYDPTAMLPDDPEFHEELLAYTYDLDLATGEIKICPKDQVSAKIGWRSPDKASAFMLNFAIPDEAGTGELETHDYIN